MSAPLREGYLSPEELRREFWHDVERWLVERHGMPPSQARQDVAHYQGRMAFHGAIEVVYHREPAEIAKAISGGRFRVPAPWEEENR